MSGLFIFGHICLPCPLNWKLCVFRRSLATARDSMAVGPTILLTRMSQAVLLLGLPDSFLVLTVGRTKTEKLYSYWTFLQKTPECEHMS